MVAEPRGLNPRSVARRASALTARLFCLDRARKMFNASMVEEVDTPILQYFFINEVLAQNLMW